MLIKKIGTSQLGKGGEGANPTKRDDETSSLNTLRNSLGTGNTLDFGTALQDRYEVEQVIGYGGMSTVYRARDLRFTEAVRVVAVKEMFDVSTDPAVREDKFRRFKQEANTLAMLNHPSIPKIYDFFPHNDRIYLIIEFVDGKNLEVLLEERNEPLEEREVLEWGAQLCEVLTYLHSQKPKPIIFRDMKPSNVMLTTTGRLMLVDFGIAKFFQEDKKGTMIGTEGYSPPEQYKGMALPGGDIYALGATLHQLLTNNDPRVEIPFTFHERRPHTLNPKISAETDAVIMKALEFDINRRWTTAVEFQHVMLNAIQPGTSNTTTTTANNSSSTRDLNLPIKNGRLTTNALEVAQFSPMVNPTLPTSHLARPVAAPAARPEELGLRNDTPVAKMVWSFGSEEEVRSSPVVNQNMVFIGSYDSNLYALDAKNGQFIWKAATNGGVAGTPCLAEQLIVVGSEDGSVYAFDQSRGQQQWVFRTTGPVRSSPRYQPPMIFFGSDDYHIYCVEARTGRQAWKARTWKPVRSSAVISAGKIFIGSDDSQLYALDGSNGNQVWKWRAQDEIRSSPAVYDNKIFVGSMDSHIYCIDAQTSWPLWKHKTGGYVSSSPTVQNNKVYVGSVDGCLYCLEAKNGKLVWKFNTGSQITSSPRVVEGVVYFGANDRNVYALDAENGNPKWYYPTEGAVPSSPAVANGIVYVGSIDYRLYALMARLGS
ncbi:MAG: serine/threonine-protein kinase [Chloroflexi bacterium]|nr:serine/threonine-protein kinase [Chloroflexota bacterium]